MKPSKRKRRIQAIKARLKEYYHLKEKNNYFKRNFIELTRPPADYSLFTDNKSTNFAKLSTSNIFLATNTFNEIVTFKKGLKVSESGPVITSNDTTLNLPNTSTPLLKAQSLILNGVSTFNNEIRVSTIAGLTSAPIKVTSAANLNKGNYGFTSNI